MSFNPGLSKRGQEVILITNQRERPTYLQLLTTIMSLKLFLGFHIGFEINIGKSPQ